MINVTKTYLPDLESYKAQLEGIWERAWLTNNGPLVQELESKLRAHLGVEQLYAYSNGTIVLQFALKVLNISGEVITTPFSYVATTNALIWHNCKPVFVDIDPQTYCIDPELIEAAITEKTTAIMATHVYGNACDVEKIEAIAKKHNLKIIYDAAHTFGVKYKGQSLLNHGDVSTLSFHATKVFHTVEGGAIVSPHLHLKEELELLRAFGHRGDEYYKMVGINGKLSEFHAAMGLCMLPHVDELIAKRKVLSDLYDANLDYSKLSQPTFVAGLERNYAYYPTVFQSETQLRTVFAALNQHQIQPRRYFYPSLNTLPFFDTKHDCPISENISPRAAALPLYPELEPETVLKICELVNAAL